MIEGIKERLYLLGFAMMLIIVGMISPKDALDILKDSVEKL